MIFYVLVKIIVENLESAKIINASVHNIFMTLNKLKYTCNKATIVQFQIAHKLVMFSIVKHGKFNNFIF